MLVRASSQVKRVRFITDRPRVSRSRFSPIFGSVPRDINPSGVLARKRITSPPPLPRPFAIVHYTRVRRGLRRQVYEKSSAGAVDEGALFSFVATLKRTPLSSSSYPPLMPCGQNFRSPPRSLSSLYPSATRAFRTNFLSFSLCISVPLSFSSARVPRPVCPPSLNSFRSFRDLPARALLPASQRSAWGDLPRPISEWFQGEKMGNFRSFPFSWRNEKVI